MARLVDRDWAWQQASEGKLKVHSGVKWNDNWYVIWKDDDGPIYSSLADVGWMRKIGARDWIHMGAYDTITERVMYGTSGSLG